MIQNDVGDDGKKPLMRILTRRGFKNLSHCETRRKVIQSGNCFLFSIFSKNGKIWNN